MIADQRIRGTAAVLCRIAALFLLPLALATPAHGQRSEDWLPLTQADRQVREVPGDPGAPAVQLYYADFRDDIHQYRFIYHRIKVLKDRGKSFADVEIPVPPSYTMSELQARVVHPDGRVADFTGKPFEKLVVRQGADRWIAKAFTLPDVAPGSIIEYKYRLAWDKYFDDTTWSVQHELYTVKEHFWLRPFQGPIRTRSISDDTRLSYVYSNMPAGVAPQQTASGIELHMADVPAFKPERYMPPPENFKWEVRFFYGGHEIESPDIFWREIEKDSNEKAERFIGNHSELKAAASSIAGAEPDPEGRLRKLYARVQQVRNLSYERERAKVEEKKEDLKPNESVMDVFIRGYGTRDEIAELFVALARAAGFRAQLLRASSREDRVFDPKLLSEAQLISDIVRVNVNGADLYLDPGTRFCPFGLVAWPHTSVPALELGKGRGDFAVIPTPTADKTVTRRTATLTLQSDGSLEGEVVLQFKGNEALQHRLGALATDDAGLREELEDELRSSLPSGALVHLEDSRGWDSSDDALQARFAVQLPGFATVAGSRLLLPAGFFRSQQMDAFATSERRYPIYFPYTYEEIGNVTIDLGDDFQVDAVPNGQDVRLASTRFITTRSIQPRQLMLTEALVVNSIYFQPDQYAQLRGFFNRLQTAEEERIVIHTRSSAGSN